MKHCKVEGCTSNVWYKDEGQDECFGHYQKRLADERRAATPKKVVGRPKKIEHEDCFACPPDDVRPASTKGMCARCYQRARRAASIWDDDG